MTNPQISVVVPVYNTDKYLSRCIDSMLAQTYTDFELLLVNDGSTDNSGAICDDYAKKDSRIRVLHKKNGGVSSARNMGLDNARGEWIAFVDADDWVREDFLQKRYELAIKEEADIAYGDVMCVFRSCEEYLPMAVIDPKTSSQVNSWILSRTTYSPVLLIHRSLFERSKLRYIEHIRFGEDFNLILKLIHRANKVVHVKEPLYFYNKQNEGSAMHKLHLYRDDLQLVYTDLIEYFKAERCYENYQRMLSWCILEYKLVSIVNREHSWDDLKDFYPGSHMYIWDNGFLDFKSKLLLFCFAHHLGTISRMMLLGYAFLKRNR